jgi:hypothetical protein
MCALYKAYNGERAWKDIETGYRRHTTRVKLITVRKFSFVDRTIVNSNRLPEVAIGTSLVKTHVFRKRVKKVQ